MLRHRWKGPRESMHRYTSARNYVLQGIPLFVNIFALDSFGSHSFTTTRKINNLNRLGSLFICHTG